jgi:putative nucleotidyltransferase with HDIG domain
MSLEPSFEEQELLADTLERGTSAMSGPEFAVGLLVAAAFLAAVAGLWLISPPQAFQVAPALACLLVLVLAMGVTFDTPLGFTDATQLGFVPLLFAMPVALVPIAVVVAQAIACLPAVRSGELRPIRLLQIPFNSFFALGPVAVLAIAHVAPAHAGALLLVAALAAQFLVNFLVTAVRHFMVQSGPVTSLLRITWVYAIDAALSGVGLVVAEDIHKTPIAALAVVPLLGLLAVFAHERHQRLQSMLELSSAYRGTALVLGDVIEADDGYTGEHCKSVVSLTLELAEHLGLAPEQQRNLEFAALLHDVGKIAIPKEIINKPGKLDPHEWTVIKTHTVEGQNLLERVGGFMRDVGRIVRSHHERWDGGGYPDGLVGHGIPLEARIIAVCDTWNAMRTDRPYRNALAHDIAVAELRASAGTQFDPNLVEVFIGEVVGPVQPGEPAPDQVRSASVSLAPGRLVADAASS